MAETIIEKGTAMEGMYEKFSADDKARVAKLTAVFSTVRHFTKIAIGQIVLSKKEPFLLTRSLVLLQLQ